VAVRAALPGGQGYPRTAEAVIKNQPPIRHLARGSDSTAGTDRTDAKAPAAPSPKSVDLSAQSSQIAALESSHSTDSGFDAKRVEAIKQAIVDGQLSVNAETVADRMIASALSMFDRRA
jgi:negative regulator of flagellin synthesis FlgM